MGHLGFSINDMNSGKVDGDKQSFGETGRLALLKWKIQKILMVNSQNRNIEMYLKNQSY